MNYRSPRNSTDSRNSLDGQSLPDETFQNLDELSAELDAMIDDSIEKMTEFQWRLKNYASDQETHREILKSMMTKLALFINDLRRKNEDEINRTMAVAGEFGETSDE